jgi:hypothetical protein
MVEPRTDALAIFVICFLTSVLAADVTAVLILHSISNPIAVLTDPALIVIPEFFSGYA